MSAGAEIRQAIRGLRQTPVVSGAAVLCLALGLGATTAIYSAVYTALLEPLPFDRPDQLVTVYRTTPNFDTGPFSPANYLDLRSETTSLSSLIAIGRATWLLQGPDETMRVSVLRASGNVFAAIGTRPVRGRLFSDADDAEGATPVVVLAESFWRARFGADPAFIGSTVRLDGEVFEVIGVAPESFRIPHGNQALGADVWVPMRFSANEAATRGSNYLLVMGRLRDNASVAAADAELKQIMDRIIDANPDLERRLLRGRLLDDRDRDGAPFAVVVNQALVDRDFPGEDPIGKRFHLSDTVFATIVGIVSNIRNVGPDREAHPGVYYGYGQSQRGSTSFPILARVQGEPTRYATAVTRAVHSVDPNAAVSRIQPMTGIIAASMGRPRFYLSLLGSFAAVALLLSLAGLYGVMSYVVAQRTREIGIRTALGSTPRRTLGLVLRQGMLLVGAGLLLGLAGGFGLTRLLGASLYGVSPLDALTWLTVALLLAAAAALAILFPARRAATVDPLVAMRVD
jgi:hypothetical protein